MRILVKGPGLTRTGYGEHCRFILRALRQIEGIDIFFIPTGWGNSNWIWENNEERRWLDDIVKKTAVHIENKHNFDLSLQVTIPNEWENLAPVNIGVTAGIETTKVAPIWLQKANEMDKIITISEHSKKGFTDTAVEAIDNATGKQFLYKYDKTPEVLHYPVKKYKKVELDLNLDTKFNFLTVAQWGPRKNIKNTIRWFVEEFYDNPDVGLVVKTFIKGGSRLDKEKVTGKISRLLEKYKNRLCKVYVLHGDFTDQEMHSLYSHEKIHCLASLTHGEGFGLPLFEAAYSGLPVLATDWSGHLDFLYKPVKNKKGKLKATPHFARVKYELKEIQKSVVWKGVLEASSEWAYPEQGSCKMKMREVYKDYGRYLSQAKKLKNWIHEEFSEEKQYQRFSDLVKEYIIGDSSPISDEELDDLFSQM